MNKQVHELNTEELIERAHKEIDCFERTSALVGSRILKEYEDLVKKMNDMQCSSDVVCGCHKPNVDNTTHPPKKK